MSNLAIVSDILEDMIHEVLVQGIEKEKVFISIGFEEPDCEEIEPIIEEYLLKYHPYMEVDVEEGYIYLSCDLEDVPQEIMESVIIYESI